MGTPQTAAYTLEQLIAAPDPVVGVVTQPDRPAGRGQKIVPSPVRVIAERHGIPVATPEKIRTPEFLETLKSWNPAVIVVVAYGRILPRMILEAAPHGCVNVHYSLLPKYRGAAPATWAIARGETHTGVTTMQLVEKMDAGPIYLQEEVALASDETTASLQAKLTPVGAGLLLETVQKLKNGSLVPRAQDESAVTFAPMLKKEDGLIDWGMPAVEIQRRVRAFTPWPSAYTYVRGQLMKIHRAAVLSPPHPYGAGEVIRADGGGFWVGAGADALSLEEVQLENRKRLSGVDFIKGARIKAGERL
jgi:methionyl-tRNA formyltransferase